MSGFAQAIIRPAAQDVRLARAKPDPRRFAMLVAPLALFLVAFHTFGLEQRAFFPLACIVFAGFAVSYWLPFRFKEIFFIFLSLAGAYLLLAPVVATLLIASGLLIFAVVRSGLSFRWRIAVLAALLCLFAYGRATDRLPVPRELWPVLGSIFFFRMIVYLYDLKYQRGPAGFKDFLSYFFLLPNYYFLLFPVIDLQTFRKSYFARDMNLVAGNGVWRIFRGITQLAGYRVIYYLQGLVSPQRVPVGAAVAVKIACCYLLYMRISGQFHIITGMLQLFGYDLPVTNRRYLLSRGINDLWRRINIYWKDFMVKIFYFPVYFKMRRLGERRAQLLATIFVIVVTWLLHACLFFWLQGRFRITTNDTLFWIILGSLMVAGVWTDGRRGKPQPADGWRPRLGAAVQIAATFAFMAVAWSMWSAANLDEWVQFLRSGNVR